MTVGQLKELLKDVPDDHVVFHATYEYKGSTAETREVERHDKPGWGIPAPCLILR